MSVAAAASTFRLISSFGCAGHLQAEADIAAHAHMRIERVGLEDHRQAALGRRHVDDVDAVDEDLAGGHVLQAGDQAKQRGLAAAGRTDEDDERAVVDLEIDIVDDVNAAEALVDALELDLPHRFLLAEDHFTAPKVMPRTSCFWLNQPMIRIGAMASVEAADSFAQNKPSGLE